MQRLIEQTCLLCNWSIF